MSYLFPMNPTKDIDPSPFGIAACVAIVCFAISYVASVPMSDAVMTRNGPKKKKLSLIFLLGWITLGVMSGLDVASDKNLDKSHAGSRCLCIMFGPFTVILSQKILFGARKTGTFWDEKGTPNFNPIVYSMGGPLFVWGWFMFWIGTCGTPQLMGIDTFTKPSATPAT